MCVKCEYARHRTVKILKILRNTILKHFVFKKGEALSNFITSWVVVMHILTTASVCSDHLNLSVHRILQHNITSLEMAASCYHG